MNNNNSLFFFFFFSFSLDARLRHLIQYRIGSLHCCVASPLLLADGCHYQTHIRSKSRRPFAIGPHVATAAPKQRTGNFSLLPSAVAHNSFRRCNIRLPNRERKEKKKGEDALVPPPPLLLLLLPRLPQKVFLSISEATKMRRATDNRPPRIETDRISPKGVQCGTPKTV